PPSRRPDGRGDRRRVASPPGGRRHRRYLPRPRHRAGTPAVGRGDDGALRAWRQLHDVPERRDGSGVPVSDRWAERCLRGRCGRVASVTITPRRTPRRGVRDGASLNHPPGRPSWGISTDDTRGWRLLAAPSRFVPGGAPARPPPGHPVDWWTHPPKAASTPANHSPLTARPH